MSKKHPECPMYNHDNCREIHSPKLCAIVKEDKICHRKKGNPKGKSKKKVGYDLGEWTVSDEVRGSY